MSGAPIANFSRWQGRITAGPSYWQTTIKDALGWLLLKSLGGNCLHAR